MTENDQRAHARVVVNHEFKTIDAFLTEYVSDISEGGVFIRSKTPLPKGTKVELCFSIILDDVETIEGEGEVVRVSDDGMGVAFTKLTDKSQRLINELRARKQGLKVTPEDDEGEGEVITLDTPQ